MRWGEAVRLTKILTGDPSSQVAAAIVGWEYPFSWEAVLLADLVDVQVASKSKKKQKPWPRPWKKSDKSKRAIGTPVTIAEFEKMRARARNAKSREISLTP